MALGNPTIFRGIKSLTFYNRTTRKPIAFFRVLSEANIESNPEYEELKIGGILWDSELKELVYGLSCTGYQYDIEGMELLSGGTKTALTSEANGKIYDEENVKGSSVLSATTGIVLSLTSADSGDLKEGEYVIEATAATKVIVYAMTDVSFADGNDGELLDSTLAITEELTITASTASVLAAYGLTLTGGSGTIGFTVGDTARFRVRRALATGYSLRVGARNTNFSDVGVLITPKKKNSAYTFIDVFRVQAAGLPLGFKDGYSELQLNMKMLYDSDKDGYYDLIRTDL